MKLKGKTIQGWHKEAVRLLREIRKLRADASKTFLKEYKHGQQMEKERDEAMQVVDGLVEAYDNGMVNGGCVDWQEIDIVHALANRIKEAQR